MKIYVVVDGRPSGPFLPWDIREKLDQGAWSPDMLGWHDGVESWMPLADLPGLTWHGPKPPPVPPAAASTFPPGPDPSTAAGRCLDTHPRPVARWLARQVDQLLALVLAAALVRLIGASFRDFLLSGLQQTIFLLALVALDTAFVHLFRTTPGKWIFGLMVRSTDHDGPIPVSVAARRALSNMIIGNALMIIGISQIAWLAHFFLLRKRERTVWDEQLGLQVVRIHPRGGFGIAVAVTLLLMMVLDFLVGPETRAVYQELIKALPER